MYKPGEVVLARIQFTDTFEIKKRPALVLYEDMGNIVVAGITSNTAMKGIPIKRSEGALKESVVKLNYIFTISEKMIEKRLFDLTEEKKRLVYRSLLHSLEPLNE